MKRLVLATVLVVLSAALAFGAVQDFGKFTVDVADGWTAKQTGPAVVITKNDNTAALSLTVDAAQGNSAEVLANTFAEQFKGSFEKIGTPEKDADGDYSWDMVSNGVTTNAILRVDDGDYMLITMTNLEAAAEEISAMLDSVKDK